MDGARIYELERAIIGAVILYGYPAIKRAEKSRELEMSARHKKIWEDLRELATADAEAKNIPFSLIERGHIVRDVTHFQNAACGLDAVEGLADILHREAARREAIRQKLQEIEELKAGAEVDLPDSTPKVFTAVSILNSEFPDPPWLIPEILPVGTSLLVAPPKKGKSWMVLGFGVALSCGGRALGKIKVEEMDVLYLALEDNPRRIKSRLQKIKAQPSPRFKVAFDWPRGVDGAAALEQYLEDNPETKFIIIDTLEKIRPVQDGRSSIYSADYEAIALLKKITDKQDVGILIVHHTRKAGSDDPLAMVSGSHGLTGAVDNVLMLSRGKGQADGVLYVTGRDIEEKELALKVDPYAGWTLLGDAAEYAQTKERREILDVLESSEEPMTPREIADATGKTSAAVKMMLARLEREDFIKRVGHGKYIAKCYFSYFQEKDQLKPQKKSNTPDVTSVTFKKVTKVTPGNNGDVTFKIPFDQGEDTQSNKVTEINNIDLYDMDFS